MTKIETLMVTPYAPYRDGIATYAIQEVQQRIAAGERLEVLSPKPSAAHHHLSLGDLRGVLALIKKAPIAEQMVIQFFPEMMFGKCRNPVERVLVWSALTQLARRTTLEIRIHEIEYSPLRRNPLEKKAAAAALQACSSVTVHTEAEVLEISDCLDIPKSVVTLVEHGCHFRPATVVTKTEARKQLGLPARSHLFLCIGFLQEHKGFHQAIKSFEQANMLGTQLYIVGSTRVDAPDLLKYASGLEFLARKTTGVTLKKQYVSDEEFDKWILAADTVVVPYKEIWSSGVLERAKLFDKAVIAANIGGMGDQADEKTILFSDYSDLAKAFESRVPNHKKRSAPKRKSAIDVSAIEETIRSQARERTGVGENSYKADGTAVEALVTMNLLQHPHPVSARPGVSKVKRMIKRLTDWRIQPVVSQIELLQGNITGAIIELEEKISVQKNVKKSKSKSVSSQKQKSKK